ncbi:Mnd1 [Trypanosoma melophagium]|uniref:Mnd1 n=1 Tax=Trypanosoma melophagium TaxID=715481 RepID=UPI00351AA378|nr:Mnd1 [Trypanosoma melophagium]
MSNAAKKKGLSMDEKVSRIEVWFISHPSPYTLKDLIAVLPKATGVIPQSIEECLEILVSENRVQQKKVGIHVLFWRFPKTATQTLAATIGGSGGTSEAEKYLNMSVAQIQEEVQTMQKKEAEVCQRIQEVRAEIGSEESEREDAEKILQLQGEKKTLQSQLEKLAVFDPPMIKKIKEATVIALEAANRWTDNIYLLELHISKRMGLSSRELRAQLQLPPDIDYIEDEDLSLCENCTEKRVVKPNNEPFFVTFSLCSKRENDCESTKAESPPAAHEADVSAALQTGTTVEEQSGLTYTKTETDGTEVKQYQGKRQRDNINETTDSIRQIENKERRTVMNEKENTGGKEITRSVNNRKKRHKK